MINTSYIYPSYLQSQSNPGLNKKANGYSFAVPKFLFRRLQMLLGTANR